MGANPEQARHRAHRGLRRRPEDGHRRRCAPASTAKSTRTPCRRDVLEAMKIGANGTPTFVIGKSVGEGVDGELVVGAHAVPDVRREAEGTGEVGLPGAPKWTGREACLLGAGRPVGYSEGNLQRHLHGARGVLLRGSDHSETGTGGIAVGRREAGMVERVVSLEAELGLQAFANHEVLVDAHVQVIGAAGADVCPNASGSCGCTRRSPGRRRSWWHRWRPVCSWRRAGSSRRSRPDRS